MCSNTSGTSIKHEFALHYAAAAEAGYCYWGDSPADDGFASVCEAALAHPDCAWQLGGAPKLDERGGHEHGGTAENPAAAAAWVAILVAVIDAAATVGAAVISTCADGGGGGEHSCGGGALQKQYGEEKFCGTKFLNQSFAGYVSAQVPYESKWKIDGCQCVEVCDTTGSLYAEKIDCEAALAAGMMARAGVCFPPDAGVPEPPDAGMPPQDSGAPAPPDASTPPHDSGAPATLDATISTWPLDGSL
jgi:hypothetical protein